MHHFENANRIVFNVVLLRHSRIEHLYPFRRKSTELRRLAISGFVSEPVVITAHMKKEEILKSIFDALPVTKRYHRLTGMKFNILEVTGRRTLGVYDHARPIDRNHLGHLTSMSTGWDRMLYIAPSRGFIRLADLDEVPQAEFDPLRLTRRDLDTEERRPFDYMSVQQGIRKDSDAEVAAKASVQYPVISLSDFRNRQGIMIEERVEIEGMIEKNYNDGAEVGNGEGKKEEEYSALKDMVIENDYDYGDETELEKQWKVVGGKIMRA